MLVDEDQMEEWIDKNPEYINDIGSNRNSFAGSMLVRSTTSQKLPWTNAELSKDIFKPDILPIQQLFEDPSKPLDRSQSNLQNVGSIPQENLFRDKHDTLTKHRLSELMNTISDNQISSQDGGSSGSRKTDTFTWPVNRKPSEESSSQSIFSLSFKKSNQQYPNHIDFLEDASVNSFKSNNSASDIADRKELEEPLSMSMLVDDQTIDQCSKMSITPSSNSKVTVDMDNLIHTTPEATGYDLLSKNRRPNSERKLCLAVSSNEKLEPNEHPDDIKSHTKSKPRVSEIYDVADDTADILNKTDASSANDNVLSNSLSSSHSFCQPEIQSRARVSQIYVIDDTVDTNQNQSVTQSSQDLEHISRIGESRRQMYDGSDLEVRSDQSFKQFRPLNKLHHSDSHLSIDRVFNPIPNQVQLENSNSKNAGRNSKMNQSYEFFHSNRPSVVSTMSDQRSSPSLKHQPNFQRVMQGSVDRRLTKDSDLNFIDLSHQQLTTLKKFISINDQFTRVKLDNNNLTFLDQLPNSPQKIFNFRLSNLTSFSHLHSLSILDVSHNNLSDLSSLSTLVNLRELYASDNQICDLVPLLKSQQLQILDLKNNSIEHLDFQFSKLCRLYYLKLSGNQLKTVQNIERLPKLQELYLDDNLLTSIHFGRSMRDLKLLNLNDNQLRDRNLLLQISNFKLFPNLKKMSIESQQSISLTLIGIHECRLKELRVNGNPTIHWGHLESYTCSRLEMGLCKLIEYPKGLVGIDQLTSLHIDHNQISNLESFTRLIHLRDLSITHNLLTDITTTCSVLSIFKKLQILDIRENPFVSNIDNLEPTQLLVSNAIVKMLLLLSCTNLKVLDSRRVRLTDYITAKERMRKLKLIATEFTKTRQEKQFHDWQPELYPLTDMTVDEEIICELIQ
ncbi:hypothetical protein HDV02_000140 [Globomyces sp. JEL0801]|nr:hypothetical protein HDV02_000140 [Globomyces sp. JEL0801]